MLDEPTAFLDLIHTYEITVLLGELARDHGKTIVFSTHDLQLSLQEADKIWLLGAEGIIQGGPEELLKGGKLGETLLEGASRNGMSLDPLTGNIRDGRDAGKNKNEPEPDIE